MNFVHTKMKKDYLMTQAATYKGRYLESVIMLTKSVLCHKNKYMHEYQWVKFDHLTSKYLYTFIVLSNYMYQANETLFQKISDEEFYVH